MRAETSLPPSSLSCILGALPAEGWPNDARSDFAFADKSLFKEFAVFFLSKNSYADPYLTKNPSIAALQDDADPIEQRVSQWIIYTPLQSNDTTKSMKKCPKLPLIHAENREDLTLTR